MEEEAEGAPEDAIYHSVSPAPCSESSTAPCGPSSPEPKRRPAVGHLQQVTPA